MWPRGTGEESDFVRAAGDPASTGAVLGDHHPFALLRRQRLRRLPQRQARGTGGVDEQPGEDLVRAAPGALAQDPADRLAGEARAPRAGARPPGRRGRRRPAHRCASVAGGRATPSGAARGPHRGPRSPPCRSDAHEPRRRAVQAFPAVGTVRRGMSPGRRPSRAPRPKVGARVAGGRRTRVGTQGA
jgi:hypothetical protein